MAALDLSQNAIAGCIRFSQQKHSAGGVTYFEPPQCGGTIFDGLPLWQRVSAALQAPVAKDYGDGYFFVVTPLTTEEALRQQYFSMTGTAGFERAITAAQEQFPTPT
ncbi:MAG: hypothetical protein QY326_10135 [Bdellovibrionota bacterium]|nr:MAG: hypothetical protein QY326_10135 [Bdellovibrionota bacterium]